ncbi:glycosyltransferase family 4 protein [bacterium]|nr:MAG: glycosyltransferase family 4 protein [bacterium]
MNITIDLRSLHTKEFSGVEYFSEQVIQHLLQLDKQNQYLLFYNGYKKKTFDQFHFVNGKYKQTRIPNRLLNLSFKFLGWPKIENLTNNNHVLLLPNPTMVSIHSVTKLILVVHDLSPVLMPEMYTLKSQLWHKMINIPKLAKRANRILAVSEYTKQTLVSEFGISPEKISVGLLGIDSNRYRYNQSIGNLRNIRNVYGLPGEFILFIGTLEPRKNLSRLIKAYEALDTEASLVIAGKKGWRYAEVMQLIESSPKRKQIVYLGYISEEHKPGLIKLAKVFAWPSLYEGFGLPVLEAMAVGTPVLTSNVTSLPEVVGDSAITVNPYNITEITQGLNVLLNDSAVRENYIAKGLERSQKFNWDKTAQVLHSLLA